MVNDRPASPYAYEECRLVDTIVLTKNHKLAANNLI